MCDHDQDQQFSKGTAHGFGSTSQRRVDLNAEHYLASQKLPEANMGGHMGRAHVAETLYLPR